MCIPHTAIVATAIVKHFVLYIILYYNIILTIFFFFFFVYFFPTIYKNILTARRIIIKYNPGCGNHIIWYITRTLWLAYIYKIWFRSRSLIFIYRRWSGMFLYIYNVRAYRINRTLYLYSSTNLVWCNKVL